MTRISRYWGLTLVELLVALAVTGVVLAALTAIFVSQTRVSERAQDRNEVDNKLRTVAEVVMQDLQQAGSVATFDGVTQPAYFSGNLGPGCASSTRSGCVALDTPSSDLTIYYMTSLVRPIGGSWSSGGAACRQIDYLIVGDELFRRDVVCGDDSVAVDDFVFSFATGIEDISITFVCHDPETTVTDISACYTATTYPREATVIVVGGPQSARNDSVVSLEMATPLPNLRPPVEYDAVPAPVGG